MKKDNYEYEDYFGKDKECWRPNGTHENYKNDVKEILNSTTDSVKKLEMIEAFKQNPPKPSHWCKNTKHGCPYIDIVLEEFNRKQK